MDTGRFIRGIGQIHRAAEVLHCARTVREWRALSLAYAGIRQWPAGKSVRMRDGSGSIVLETAADVATFWSIFFAHPYPVLESDEFILDAGSNIGAFSLYAAGVARRARILAVEPFPATFSRLENVVSQPWIDGRIHAVRAALAGRDGEGTIEAESELGSQFRRMSTVSGRSAGVSVPTVSLQSLMDAHRLDRIDILKMDIEGSEYDVLLSAPDAVLLRISRMCLEYHPQPLKAEHRPEMIIERLSTTGLKLIRHADHGEGYGILQFERNAVRG